MPPDRPESTQINLPANPQSVRGQALHQESPESTPINPAANLEIKPLTPELMDDLGAILRGNFGAGCWCMFPRLTDAQARQLPGDGPLSPRRRTAMTQLAARHPSPGLLAYANGEAVGWIAIAPRSEYARIVRSKATPPVDDAPVWIIPCITVRKGHRGQGIALALIQAAVAHAAQHGAPAIEAYPRADHHRTADDNAYFGTEPLFRRAGFHVIREPLDNRPRHWLPRVAMRITVTAASG